MKKSCPNEEKLADYLEHRLSGQDKARIEAHLSGCDNCLEDFIVTRGQVRGNPDLELEPVPDRLTQKAIEISRCKRGASLGAFKLSLEHSLKNLPRKLRGLLDLAQWEQWRLAPVRSTKEIVSSNLIRIRKVFRGLDVGIEIEKTGENRSKLRVELLKNGQGRKAVRVSLFRGERELCSNSLSEGYVLFEDIAFGHYSLLFYRGEEAVGKYLFEIKESSNG